MIRESDQDTIAAIATPPGEGGIGIVRLSGKDAIAIAGRLFVSKSGEPAANQNSFTARYGRIVSEAGDTVDEGLLLLMRAPGSYTGEDVAEIQVHGSQAVLSEALALALRHGARLAGHGEFTKRAFLNGRMDLLQAEAVLDLIQAKTEKSRRWASAQLAGSLTKKTQGLKQSLLEVLSELEASIDFPEEDIQIEDYSQIMLKLSAMEKLIQSLLRGSELGFLAKKGIRVALWGSPNTGKSSLMNCLVRHNRVIVTPIPGTTRDVVEEEIQIGGFPVKILDTAGVRVLSSGREEDAVHLIEKEGIERSRRAMTGADLVLFVMDRSRFFEGEDLALFDEIRGKEKIVVLNKSDLQPALDRNILSRLDGRLKIVETSCAAEKGIEELEKAIFDWMTHGKSGISDESVVSSIRQREAIEKILMCVQAALSACESVISPELIAVDVRLALDRLGVLVGDVVTEDILDVLFSRFCIGK